MKHGSPRDSKLKASALAILSSFVLAACGSDGTTTTMATATPVTPTPVGSVPGAPTIGAVTPGNASASVAFTAPSSTGSAPITSYTASCTAAAATVTASGTASPITVSGLTNGTAYGCSVTATNSVGTSAASTVASVTPTAPVTVTPTPIVSTCPAAAHFPDVSQISNYIDWNDDNVTPPTMPSTSVSCANGVVSVVSNGVPNFDALGNGRGAADVAWFTNQKTWVFPINPTKVTTPVVVLDVLGPIGILVNGVQFYSPIDAEGTDAGATASNYCGGHTERFHSHAYPACFFSKITEGGTKTFLPDRTPGTVVGYAFDGYPVLSPYITCTDTASDCINGVREIKSAYEYRGTNLQTDKTSTVNIYVAGYGGSPLDACNGMTRDGSYAYYATKNYPYFLGCYTGVATSNR
jgi:YHYH protein/Fibronectin type III domain